MENCNERLVHLANCKHIGWKTIARILETDPSLRLMYDQPVTYWRRIIHKCSNSMLYAFLSDLDCIKLKKCYSEYIDRGINVITIFDQVYPGRLREIANPPWVLYCDGDLSLFDSDKILAVIGSRSPSAYGIEATKKIMLDIAGDDEIVIVSGLAKGIDSLAQRQGLIQKNKVISVIGGGFDNIYPKENEQLARTIGKKGLLISEYPPRTKAERWHFPMRNRIISGVSRGILVVEAKEKSGTLITVHHGLEQGKDIFAIPGAINSELSVGCNFLIKEGAILVQSGEDIVGEWK